MVADGDTESNSAAILHDANQPMAYTPFGAMIAKHIHNATINKQQPYTGQIAIGQNGQTQVKQVSFILFIFILFFENVNKLFDICRVYCTNVYDIKKVELRRWAMGHLVSLS